jgi:hypothetical protein
MRSGKEGIVVLATGTQPTLGVSLSYRGDTRIAQPPSKIHSDFSATGLKMSTSSWLVVADCADPTILVDLPLLDSTNFGEPKLHAPGPFLAASNGPQT